MALQGIYKVYLDGKDPALLSDNASLHYVPTLTTINASAAIAKHHAAHKKVLNKKEEKVLNSVEGSNSICLEIETTLEFVLGGGAYLPGLDDNFVSNRTVVLPMVYTLASILHNRG